MSSRRRIAGTGLFALDVVVGPDGELVGSSMGGSAGNVLAILGALGWTATPIATLGDDEAADHLIASWREIGADLRFVRRSSNQQTPVVFQHLLPIGSGRTHRFSFACPQCGHRIEPRLEHEVALDSEDTPEELPRMDVYFLDRVTAHGVDLAEYYAAQGALIVFEPSELGDPYLVRRVLNVAHIVKYADDRIVDLELGDHGSVILEIQTLGLRGLRFRAAAMSPEWSYLGAYAVPDVADTSGAGDWCTAGLIHDLLDRRAASSLKKVDRERLMHALAYGQALASLNCMVVGARGLLGVMSAEHVIDFSNELVAARMQAIAEHRLDANGTVWDSALDQLRREAMTIEPHKTLGGSAFPCCPSGRARD